MNIPRQKGSAAKRSLFAFFFHSPARTIILVSSRLVQSGPAEISAEQAVLFIRIRYIGEDVRRVATIEFQAETQRK
jgi:hypothetical protein